jgi:hypothetical protein
MSCLDFAKPLIMEFVGGSIADRVSDGLLRCFEKRPKKGKSEFWLKITDARTGLEVSVTGHMKSSRARDQMTKYTVDIVNTRRHSKVSIHIVDHWIHLKSNDRCITYGCRLRTLDDPRVIFDYLGLHTHPTFVLPQNVIPNGNLNGSIYVPVTSAGAGCIDVLAPPRRPEGPDYVRTLKMRTVYRNT